MTVEIILADCMEYLHALDDKTIDLAIVDPPYGIGNVLRNGKSRTKLASASNYHLYDNTKPPPPEYFAELIRVSKNQIIWGANHYCDRFNAAGSHWVIWDKSTTGPFADCELAYTSFPGPARIFRYVWNGMHQGQFGGDKSLNEQRIHPSQKPVKLYEWLLDKYAKEGDTILDTHLGSASSAIAAHRGGFKFIGIEIDQKYYLDALARFELVTAQGEMILC